MGRSLQCQRAVHRTAGKLPTIEPEKFSLFGSTLTWVTKIVSSPAPKRVSPPAGGNSPVAALLRSPKRQTHVNISLVNWPTYRCSPVVKAPFSTESSSFLRDNEYKNILFAGLMYSPLMKS